jgi:hypothetical protein
MTCTLSFMFPFPPLTTCFDPGCLGSGAILRIQRVMVKGCPSFQLIHVREARPGHPLEITGGSWRARVPRATWASPCTIDGRCERAPRGQAGVIGARKQSHVFRHGAKPLDAWRHGRFSVGPSSPEYGSPTCLIRLRRFCAVGWPRRAQAGTLRPLV